MWQPVEGEYSSLLDPAAFSSVPARYSVTPEQLGGDICEVQHDRPGWSRAAAAAGVEFDGTSTPWFRWRRRRQLHTRILGHVQNAGMTCFGVAGASPASGGSITSRAAKVKIL